jgi:hypothetical protein
LRAACTDAGAARTANDLAQESCDVIVEQLSPVDGTKADLSDDVQLRCALATAGENNPGCANESYINHVLLLRRLAQAGQFDGRPWIRDCLLYWGGVACLSLPEPPQPLAQSPAVEPERGSSTGSAAGAGSDRVGTRPDTWTREGGYRGYGPGTCRIGGTGCGTGFTCPSGSAPLIADPEVGRCRANVPAAITSGGSRSNDPDVQCFGECLCGGAERAQQIINGLRINGYTEGLPSNPNAAYCPPRMCSGALRSFRRARGLGDNCRVDGALLNALRR